MKHLVNRFNRHVCLAVILLGSVLVAGSANAMQAPDVVVKNTIDKMVNNIQANRALYQKDSNKLYAMVERVLVPTLHLERMSKLVLGKQSARAASKTQMAAFVSEFKTYLMRSYATALLEYTGEEKVIYQPLSLEPGADKAVVRAALIASDGQEYPINLYMSNRRDTSWRAYNLDVAGINFVSIYRSTFGDIITKKGVDGLITELKDKNAKTAS
jgi:phospholipid transport system substrate-binding protein